MGSIEELNMTCILAIFFFWSFTFIFMKRHCPHNEIELEFLSLRQLPFEGIVD